eukprot:scaffold1997_cov318-Pavlova_lutheri.AAC.17
MFAFFRKAYNSHLNNARKRFRLSKTDITPMKVHLARRGGGEGHPTSSPHVRMQSTNIRAIPTTEAKEFIGCEHTRQDLGRCPHANSNLGYESNEKGHLFTRNHDKVTL